jgi:hypothetical protein
MDFDALIRAAKKSAGELGLQLHITALVDHIEQH